MAKRRLSHILYVEDDADIREIVRLSLESVGGFNIAVCASGVAAVEVAPSVKPDLILMDVMMPDMDGPSTLRALRALPETTTTPVIFFTAKVQPGDLEQYKESGALDVIFKPFDPMRLPSDISRIWAKHYG
ncbi:MAG: response regulator [Acidiferrobacterales bacterium]